MTNTKKNRSAKVTAATNTAKFKAPTKPKANKTNHLHVDQKTRLILIARELKQKAHDLDEMGDAFWLLGHEVEQIIEASY